MQLACEMVATTARSFRSSRLQKRSGLSLVDLDPVFNDPETGEILQLNGLFARLRDTFKRPFEARARSLRAADRHSAVGTSRAHQALAASQEVQTYGWTSSSVGLRIRQGKANATSTAPVVDYGRRAGTR